MFDAILGGLFAGWILKLFSFDKILIGGINELFGAQLSINSYYLLFVAASVAYEIYTIKDKIRYEFRDDDDCKEQLKDNIKKEDD
jgi:hypothetical protein